MDWNAIAAIGSFVSALAMLITLIFLALQVRHNDKTQREANAIASAAAVDQVFDQFTGWRRLVASDADLTRIWLDGREGKLTDPIDVRRFEWLAIDYMLAFANWQIRGEAVGQKMMSDIAINELASMLNQFKGLRDLWHSSASDTVMPEFREKVNSRLTKD